MELDKVWLITGITGQDGSYMADYLLSLGYTNIHGIMRRSATFNTQNIDHIFDKLKLYHGDLTDTMNIHTIISKVKPDFIVNFAAQSHVKVSHDLENYTFQTNTIGVLNILQSVRSLGLEKSCRIYHASTSEMYGNSTDGSVLLNEDSPMNPVSIYGISKKAAQEMCNMYRDAYGMFIVSSVLFNHETIAGIMPVIFKSNGNIDIKPISEVVKYHTRNSSFPAIDERHNCYQETSVYTDLQIWDDDKWSKVTYASGYPHDTVNDPKFPKYVISKNAAYLATDTHPIIMDDDTEKDVKDIELGDKVKLTKYPLQCNNNTDLSVEEAVMYGLICGDGYISDGGRCFRITNSDTKIQELCKELWETICEKNGYTYRSGYNPDKIVGYVSFQSYDWIRREQFYDSYKYKRVPQVILNSSVEIQRAFVEGYNKADGLKSTVYHFNKTNSPTLASGLLYLMSRVSPYQNYNVNIDVKTEVDDNGQEKLSYYYALTFSSDTKHSAIKSIDKYHTVNSGVNDKTEGLKNGFVPTGEHHLQVPDNTVKKLIEVYDYDGWFYDLETESGTFHCGVGKGVVHNSPRRGHTFVTQKIAYHVANFSENSKPLELGNLNARRDWGSADDYVIAVYMMLMGKTPTNYVVATGETHSVREFVTVAFKLCDVDIEWIGEGKFELGVDKATRQILVKVNPKYYRDIDIECLIGDASKITREIGWYPKKSFKVLVTEMVNSAMEKKQSNQRKLWV